MIIFYELATALAIIVGGLALFLIGVILYYVMFKSGRFILIKFMGGSKRLMKLLSRKKKLN
jgi:hypothetical protein